MTLTPEAVLAHIAAHGPAVPNQLRQALGAQDNFVVGAVLSELVSSGKLALTTLTFGTSKFYYDPKKPELLEALGAHLGEKDRRAFELLKSERVVRQGELSPLNRVAIAAIADFSRRLPVETPSGQETFWRYYLVSEDDAFTMIIDRWFPSSKQPAPPIAPAPIHVPDLVKVADSAQPVSAPQPSITPSEKPVEVPQPTPVPKRAPAKKKAVSKRTRTGGASGGSTSAKKSVTSVKARAPAAPSEFSEGIAEYFSVRNIRLDEDLGSTKTEMTALVRVPSAIGEMRYYCKAKTKKLTADGDLASAFLEAQQRGLPLLYLAAGSLSKKAQEALPGLKGAVVAYPFAEEETH